MTEERSRKWDPASFCRSQNYAAAIDAEGGIKKRSAKSIAQSVQKVENKRITTEGHGATRKDSVYKFVVSV